MSEAKQGRIIWRELLSAAPEQAADFYSGLFDWQTTRSGGQRWLWKDGKRLASITALPSGAGGEVPGMWLPYVTVDDLAATLVAAGKLDVRPATTEVRHDAGGCRFVVLGDRRGALTVAVEHDDAARRPAPFRHHDDQLADKGHVPRPPAGYFCWDQLNTSDGDLSAVADEFAALYGWQMKQRSNGSALRAAFHSDGAPVAGVHTMPAQEDLPDHWLPFVRVADVARTARRAKRLDGEVYLEPRSHAEYGSFAVLADPTGGVVGVCNWGEAA